MGPSYVKPAVCPGTGERHRYEFIGSAGRLSGRVGQGRCDNAKWLVCLKCAADLVMPCGSTSAVKCRPCGLRYKRRVAGRVRRGLAGRNVLELTWTAPGDKPECRVHRDCDGLGEGCEQYVYLPDDRAKAEWMSTLWVRLNRLFEDIKRGKASPLRHGKRRKYPELEYFEVKEVYRELLVHGHALLALPPGLEWDLSEKLLRGLLIHHGFGRKLSLKAHNTDNQAAANYLSKSCGAYLSKTVDQRRYVQVLDDSGQFRPYRGRAWRCSRRWEPKAQADPAKALDTFVGEGQGSPSIAGEGPARIGVADPLVSFIALPTQALPPASDSPPDLSFLFSTFPDSEVVF